MTFFAGRPDHLWFMPAYCLAIYWLQNLGSLRWLRYNRLKQEEINGSFVLFCFLFVCCLFVLFHKWQFHKHLQHIKKWVFLTYCKSISQSLLYRKKLWCAINPPCVQGSHKVRMSWQVICITNVWFCCCRSFVFFFCLFVFVLFFQCDFWILPHFKN